MKIQTITSCLASLFLLFVWNTNTSFSPEGRNNNTACSNCHGSGNPGSMTLTGIPSEVAPNTTYSAELCINDPVNTDSPAIGGFRFHSSQGTYSNLEAGVRTGGSGSMLGLTHSNPKPISGGIVCWTFDWTSPASGNSNVQYYANAANGDGDNNSFDNGGYQTFAIFSVVEDPCITDLLIPDNPIPTGNYISSNSITAYTPLATDATVIFETANEVFLNPEFEVPLGTDFETIIGTGNGCLTENEDQ